MAILETAKSAFVSGEIAPEMLGRADVDRYQNAATELENWEVLVQGGVRRRAGTRYVATVKDPTRLTLLLPFEPSTTDAYVLEVGHQYIRFYKNGARIESPPGTPVEVVTPYTESQLRALRTAQSNDVMLWVHPSHAPQRLSRLSDTSWVFMAVTFDPPPLWEAGYSANVALTLSAVSGTITVTAAGALWFRSDINRVLTAGVGRVLLTAFTTELVMQGLVLNTFTSVNIAGNTWTLEGSPWATVTPSATGPIGALVTVDYGQTQPAETELMVTAFAAWTDWSGPQVMTGQHTGLNNSLDTLEDANQNFVTSGVLSTQIVDNTTDGSKAIVATVTPHALSLSGLAGGAEHDFDNGDTYVIRETGVSRVSAGVLELHGGTAGHAWREVGVATTIGVQYQISFTVTLSSVSLQVGTGATLSNVLAERSYVPGDHTATFTAASVTTYVQFRNNQNTWTGLSRCSVKRFSIETRLSAQIGSYIEMRDGLIQLLGVAGAGNSGRIVKELSSTDPAAPGAWRMLSPAWSATLGWPSTVVLYEGRLYLAGSARFPQTLWGSAVDDLFNFALGTHATDALELSLVDSGGNITLNRIRALMPAENLLVCTTHGEYRLVGAGDDPLSPTSPSRNRIQSTFGSDSVQPLKVGAALLFVQRQGSKVREMSYDERTQTTFVARDLTVTSNHLLASARIVQLAYQPEPTSVVWAVRSDGQLLGLTYDLSEQVVAWWRVVTDGTIEAVCVIPHPTALAHQVWVTVQRTLGGVATRCVERFDPEAAMLLPTPVAMPNGLTHETDTISGWTGLTLDCATVYSGINTDTLTGLAYLNDEEVSIVADGAVLAPQTVSAGTLTLPVIAHTAFVGLPYTASGKTVPVHTPVRGTSSQISRKRWTKIRVRMKETGCLVVQGERMPFRMPSMPMDQGIPPFSGDRDIVPLGWNGQAVVTFMADDPLPSTVLAIYGLLDIEAER